MKITFSSDDGKISRKDVDKINKTSEEYFGTEKDPHQISNTPKTRDWIYKNALDYLNLIRNNGKIVGHTFMLPCKQTLMDDFIKKRIDEATLFEKIKKIKLDAVPEAIYICESVVRKDFRGKGLITSSFVKTINKITHNGKEKPILFYWEFSKEGGNLVKKVAEITGMELMVRD